MPYIGKELIKIMRISILILSFLVANGCASLTEPAVSLKAIYLTHGQGQLAAQDLKDHPEIMVIEAFDELKQYTSQEIALWIDENATPLDSEQEKWINEAPQAYYPIVLVGTSDTLYSFRDLLRLCCFMGPAGDYPGYDTPGFSVIQKEETSDPTTPVVTFIEGYDRKPTVQAILEITNALLEGKSTTIPTGQAVPVVTATP